MNIQRTEVKILPEKKRVLLRPFEIGSEERVRQILKRIMAMPEKDVNRRIEQVIDEFGYRHRSLEKYILMRFEAVSAFLPDNRPVSDARKLLIGAYFTHEYSIEAAALFNPSIVWHPDQKGLPAGSRRFIISLRAVGEGHISSITFRSGVIDTANRIFMDAITRYITAPEIFPEPVYNRNRIKEICMSLGENSEFASRLPDALDDNFTLSELRGAVQGFLQRAGGPDPHNQRFAERLLMLAESNYEFTFSPQVPLCERVIFPHFPSESNGMEDARFVEFRNGTNDSTYYATCTAYDGHSISSRLLETKDFLHFKVQTPGGSAIENKGLALFPRKVNGRYAMLGRQDNENLYLMYSDNICIWEDKKVVFQPQFGWEFIQIGNCGSPIETDAGWLVLTHGVGAMRKYTIGAFLLDLKDPSRVIGRLKEPLLSADAEEREGYVPNVVYSCGGIVHGGQLFLPYGFSDSGSSFALVNLNELLQELTS